MRRNPKGKAPARPTEREVVQAIDRLLAQAASIGMPITVCAIRPSDESRVQRTIVRESGETPGVPSTEDLAYLASTVLFDCTKHVPDGARSLMVSVITEFAEDVRRRRSGEASTGLMDQGRPGLHVVDGGLSGGDGNGGASGDR